MGPCNEANAGRELIAFGATSSSLPIRAPASATAIALHMKMLFHCPKKSAVEAIGQRSEGQYPHRGDDDIFPIANRRGGTGPDNGSQKDHTGKKPDGTSLAHHLYVKICEDACYRRIPENRTCQIGAKLPQVARPDAENRGMLKRQHPGCHDLVIRAFRVNGDLSGEGVYVTGLYVRLQDQNARHAGEHAPITRTSLSGLGRQENIARAPLQTRISRLILSPVRTEK